MAAIGGHHGKALRQRERVADGVGAQRRPNRAIHASAALEEQPLVPVGGHPQLEACGVLLAIRTGPLFEVTLEAAVIGQGGVTFSDAGEELGGLNAQVRIGEVGQRGTCLARHLGLDGGCEKQGRG